MAINTPINGSGDQNPGLLWVPSDPSGASNMAGELESIIASNPNMTVYVPDDATILLNGFGQQGNLGSTDNVYINFGKSSILYDNTSRCIDLDNTANASAAFGVSALADVARNTDSLVTQITLTGTSGASAHDWIALYSADANPSKSGGRLGEIHQLIEDEFDDSGTYRLYTAGKVGRTSAFTTSVNIRILDSTRKVVIEGGTFESNGDADDSAITTREECIRIIGFVKPEVKNCIFNSPWAQCVWFQCCAAPRTKNIELKNTLNMATYNGFSYGIVLYGMNGNATIEETKIFNARHGFTTDGNSGATSTWYNKGYPTYCQFINTTGNNCYGSVGDTHEEGMFTTIDGLYANNSLQDENEIFRGIGIQSRAAYDTIRNVVVIGGCGTIKVEDIDHGFEDRVIIQNVVSIDNKVGTGVTANCINIVDQDTLTNKRKVYLDDINIDTDGNGIYVGETCKVTIGDLRIRGAEYGIEVRGGAELFIHGRNTWDWEGLANTSRCIRVRSNALLDEPRIYVMQPPTVLKGTNAFTPLNFFEETDTNANKYRYVPYINEINLDTQTATLMDESGATTFLAPPAGELNYIDGLWQGKLLDRIGTVPAPNIDCSTGNLFEYSMSGNVTFTLSNIPISGVVYRFTLRITYTSGTVTWTNFTSLTWDGGTAPSFTAAHVYDIEFITLNGGTSWTGRLVGDYT